MRELRYSVASSLDGYITGPKGEYDWIPIDPETDFVAMYAGFSELVMGRRSYGVLAATGGVPGGMPLPVHVCSRTLPEGVRDGITFARDAVSHVHALKAGGEGKPIWLWGGLPMVAPPAPTLSLRLRSNRLYPTTGALVLEYDVVR